MKAISINPFGGADFEIVPTNKIVPVRRLISFPPHVLALASVAGKPDWESQKRSGQSCSIKTGQAEHLSDPGGTVGELSGDAFSPSSAIEHIELPAKLLDYFLRSNKSNINQCIAF